MPLLIESLLTLLVFYLIGVDLGWLLWGRNSNA